MEHSRDEMLGAVGGLLGLSGCSAFDGANPSTEPTPVPMPAVPSTLATGPSSRVPADVSFAVPEAVSALGGVMAVYDRRLYKADGDCTRVDRMLRFEPVEGPYLRSGGSRWRVAIGRAVDGPCDGGQLRQPTATSQLFWFA